jgi:ribosome-associated protein
MSTSRELRQQILTAVRACEDKKAHDLSILQLDPHGGFFTDFFVICSATNQRQVQAIADEVGMKLKRAGVHPAHSEGYTQAEWVLLDYVDFVVHIFTESARRFYDLERLWKSAKKLSPAELLKPLAERTSAKRAASAHATTRISRKARAGTRRRKKR